VTGASVFLLEEGLDTGPVYGTVTEPIGPRDTSGDLLARLADSGAALLVRVLDVKRSHGQQVVVLESGINHLGGMSGLRRVPPFALSLVSVAGSGDGAADATDQRGGKTLVAGPLCTPLDTWSRTAELPRPRPGQLLAVPNVGAYGLYASLVAFLGHPMPTEVVVDSDRADAVVDVSQLRLVRVPAGSQQIPSSTAGADTGRNH